MAVLRNPNKNRFTVVDNVALRDGKLSLKARGLLVTMLSLPDNWKFSENGLCAIFQKDGQASVRSGLKELEERGYLVRERERDSLGRVTNVRWTIYDYPQLENPSMDNPSLDNRPQLNTKQLNNKKRTTDYILSGVDFREKQFSRFWDEYPKKVAKQAALKAWMKIKPDADLTDKIISAVQEQKKSAQWNKDGGQYIPNPATWLNQGRWEDELQPDQGIKTMSQKDALLEMIERGDFRDDNGGNSKDPFYFV